jgi:pre-mRNA-splicing factor SYF1
LAEFLHGFMKDTVDKEAIIREGIQKYTDEVGNLWVKLADYHTRIGDFKRAREVFEEALQIV